MRRRSAETKERWPGLRAARVASLAGVLSLALASVPARAEHLTLPQAEARALGASPAARLARLEALAAHERSMQAYARHLGEGDLVASGSRFEGARLVRPITGPITPATMAAMPFDRDQLHFGAAWQIPLFAGGALVRGDRAARLAERAADGQASHALDAAVANERALAQDDASARLQVETEAWAEADADKVGFALASAHARRAALTARLQSAQALLAAIMGEDGAVTYELEDLPEEPAALTARSSGELIGAARTNRRDLAAAGDAAEAQRARAGAVRAGFWPQLALVGSYLWNRGEDLGRVPQTYEITLQLRIPILSDVGRAFAAREADAAAAQAAERARAKALEVRGQVVDAVGRLDAARTGFEAGKAQRALGAEVARVEKLKLDSGRGKVEDYLAARAQALEGETAYWQGLYGLQSAHDYLALVTGVGGRP